MLLALKNVCCKVCIRENNLIGEEAYEVGFNLESVNKKQKEHTHNGFQLYSVLPFAYFTGSYRILNFKNFPSEIGSGLALEFFMNVLPLMFL